MLNDTKIIIKFLINELKKLLCDIVIDSNGCWNKNKNLNEHGYSRIHVNGKKQYTHRFIYKYFHGEISSSLVLDHLCQNTKCCNPVHLEAVTISENLNRGNNAKRENTHCPSGHEYNFENTYYYKKYRRCKICLAKQVNKYRLRLNNC